MKKALPFSIIKRGDRPCFLVSFKNEAGEYLSAISTRQRTEGAAIETTFKWLREGIPAKNGGAVSAAAYQLRDMIRKADFSKADAELIVKELQRRGFLQAAVFTESRGAVDCEAFFADFWNWEKSPYIAEKLRKEHGIHKCYARTQSLSVKNYWQPAFKGRALGSITADDIEVFVKGFDIMDVSYKRKNEIIRAGTIALKWAYKKRLIAEDITRGIVWYAGKAAERQILTPELAQAVFCGQWKDERAKLANQLAMLTGIRAGEIQGLRVQDLGADCLYIRHSWNYRDGLKTPKNNESRTVELPFPEVIQALKELAAANPHGYSLDSYVFWNEDIAGQPIDNRHFIAGLRDALQNTGMSAEGAAVFTFHTWRHFFTAYMREGVNEKLLQRQTGHKTLAMLDHYSAHSTEGERERLQAAQRAAFSRLLPVYSGAGHIGAVLPQGA